MHAVAGIIVYDKMAALGVLYTMLKISSKYLKAVKNGIEMKFVF